MTLTPFDGLHILDEGVDRLVCIIDAMPLQRTGQAEDRLAGYRTMPGGLYHTEALLPLAQFDHIAHAILVQERRIHRGDHRRELRDHHSRA